MSSTRPMSTFGPDFCFAYDDWIRHPAGLGSVPHDALGTDVAVIGAGISGIVAAHELMKLGLRPVVYEAGRMGGRLRSERFGAADDVVAELGGMRFPRSGRAFYHYVDQLGLTTRPFPNPLSPAAPTTVIDLFGETHHACTLDDLPAVFGEVAAAWDAALEELADLSSMKAAIAARDVEAVSELWHRLVPIWDDRTFYDFIAGSEAFAELSFWHREIFGQVGFGTGGWDSDFTNSMLEILRVVMCELEDDQHLIVGGAEQVVRRLWAHVAPTPASPDGDSLAAMHSGAPRPGVDAIGRHADGDIEVVDRNGVARRYPAVLVTTQSWLLTTAMDVQEELFPIEVWMGLDRTRYRQSAKTFVMVDHPFWNELDETTGHPKMAMTLTDRHTRGTYLFDNGPGRPGVICMSYTWDGDALKVLPLDAQERAELALRTLQKIYPGTDIASHVIGEPIAVSWEADPAFLGAFKGALPGHYRYHRRMYAHFVQDTLPDAQRGIFLAGDDVSWIPGWAEGAVQTAHNAVWGIMRHLDGSTHEDNPGPGDLWDERAPIRLPS